VHSVEGAVFIGGVRPSAMVMKAAPQPRSSTPSVCVRGRRGVCIGVHLFAFAVVRAASRLRCQARAKRFYLSLTR